VMLTGSAVRVFWHGGAMAKQFLDRTVSLTASGETWRTILTNLPPTTVSTNFTDMMVTNKVQFYRIRAIR